MTGMDIHILMMSADRPLSLPKADGTNRSRAIKRVRVRKRAVLARIDKVMHPTQRHWKRGLQSSSPNSLHAEVFNNI